MDRPIDILRSFLLWCLFNQWSLCFISCTLLKNVRIIYCVALILVSIKFCLTLLIRRLSFMIKVTFGDHNQCTSKPLLTRYVSRIITRRSLFSVVDHDIALFKLDERVPINRVIRPVCLPQNKGKITAQTGNKLGFTKSFYFRRFQPMNMSVDPELSLVGVQWLNVVNHHANCVKYTFQSLAIWIAERIPTTGI